MTDEQRGRALRLRRPDCVECLFPHGAHSWRLPRVVVGKTKVGGIDLNKARMRWVVEALIALCVSSSEARGFTASHLARQVRLLSNQAESEYGPRLAAYDLKKLRCQEHRPANRADTQIRIKCQRTQGNGSACGSKKQSHKSPC